MHKISRIVLGVVCLFGLLYVRFRESELFYDPLIKYFHGDYQNNLLPTIAQGKLVVNVLLRYIINGLLSLGIIWAVFKDKGITKFTVLFLTIVFFLLLIPFYFLLQDHNPSDYLPLFYVRRFLIQPLLVFLLIPAFFYYKRTQ